MTETTARYVDAAYDVEAVRGDFPILSRTVRNGNPLVSPRNLGDLPSYRKRASVNYIEV
jgi:hypothetical protein